MFKFCKRKQLRFMTWIYLLAQIPCKSLFFISVGTWSSIVKLNLQLSNSHRRYCIYPLSTNFTKLSNAFKQFIGKLPTNCLSMFDHFVGLAPKELSFSLQNKYILWRVVDFSSPFGRYFPSCGTFLSWLLSYVFQPVAVQIC